MQFANAETEAFEDDPLIWLGLRVFHDDAERRKQSGVVLVGCITHADFSCSVVGGLRAGGGERGIQWLGFQRCTEQCFSSIHRQPI